MEYRKLGHTDIDVTSLCLGTMTWGEQNTEAEAHEQLDYAISRGINFIDTAELYAVPARAATQGLTEQYIGTWLAQRGRRDDLILATKIAGPGPYTDHIRTDLDYTVDNIEDAVNGSLRRLQTDYIDLYQIHWPARVANFFKKRDYVHHPKWQNNIREVLEALQVQIKKGKIRYIGISNETPWGMMEYIRMSEQHDLPRIVSIQNPYNLVNRTFEIGLSEMAIRENTGLLAYSPMAFGLLSGKYHRGEDQPTDRINKYEHMQRYTRETTHAATSEYLKIAAKYGYNPGQMALAWVTTRDFVTSNIIGATTMAQLKENIDSHDMTLSKECIQEINEVHDRIPNPSP